MVNPATVAIKVDASKLEEVKAVIHWSGAVLDRLDWEGMIDAHHEAAVNLRAAWEVLLASYTPSPERAGDFDGRQ